MIYIIIFFLLLVISALFSSSETALFNIKPYQKDLSDDLKSILKFPRKLLISILTGNTLVNVGMATIAALYTHQLILDGRISAWAGMLLEIILVSIVILLFGEIIPKTLAIRYSVRVAHFTSPVLKVFIILLYPIANVFYFVMNGIMILFKIKKEQVVSSEEELKILTELGEQEGTLEEDESEMIQSVFDFKDKTVKEILTPRVDLIAISSNSTIDDVMNVISKHQFSKIPIYQDNIDNIKGMLYAKDFLPYLIGSRPGINIISLSREALFVPEAKPIDDLLREFQSKKTSIAVVVDEWGGTSGIVTLEDIVEEVLGEFRDPYDSKESIVIKLADGGYMVDGSIAIYDLEEETDLEFPDNRDYDTLGGFILDQVEDIPKKNQQVKFANRLFSVKKIKENRIEKVHISKESIDDSEK